MREDFRTADMLITKKKIEAVHMNKLAHFLEAQGYCEVAFKAEHQFELAFSLQLGDLVLASLDFVAAK